MKNALGTKGKILTAAGRLFAEQGYFGTSMSDIASEAGIGKSALYYYFESKEELCKKLMQRSFSELERDLKQAVKESLTPFDALSQIILILLNFRTKHPEINLLSSFTGDNDKNKNEPIIQYIVEMRASIHKLIRELIKEIGMTRRRDCKFMYVFSASLLGFVFGPFVPKEMNREKLAEQLTRYSLTTSKYKFRGILNKV